MSGAREGTDLQCSAQGTSTKFGTLRSQGCLLQRPALKRPVTLVSSFPSVFRWESFDVLVRVFLAMVWDLQKSSSITSTCITRIAGEADTVVEQLYGILHPYLDRKRVCSHS